VTEDGGESWRKIDSFPGIPELSYVTDVTASQHDADTVYATFNNFKMGDFKPYVLKSTDRGKTWSSIASNLSEPHVTWSIVEDHEKADLLFLGTEYGLFFTIDGGEKWIPLKGNVPVIAFRDLEIQKRENDLACATFGRGFYILDDYSPLRYVNEASLEQEGMIFPVKKTWMYVQARPLGGGEKASQGAAYFTAPNPPYGAVITYYLKDTIKTLKQIRKESESKLRKEGKPVYYPAWEDLKNEDREEKPAIILTITDEDGNVVRRLTQPAVAGIHRVAWDLRYPATTPTQIGGEGGGRWSRRAAGPVVMPGTYTVSMAKFIDGKLTPIGEPVSFITEPLGLATLPAEDKAEVLAFQQKVGRLVRAVMGANAVIGDMEKRLKYIKQAILDTPAADPVLAKQARELELRLIDIKEAFTGDPTKPRRSEPGVPGILSRVMNAVYSSWASTSKTTATQIREYEIAADQFEVALSDLRRFVEVDMKALEEVDMKALEDALESAGAPWTPGRAIPNWTKEQ